MYAVFNIALDSEIPLPELPELETADTVIKVQAGVDAGSIPEQPSWFHHWENPEGAISISCAKLGEFYLLRFPELVDFIISIPANTISYFPRKGIPPETIRHLLLDQVLPRILGQKGKLILHAAAVVTPEGHAIAFLGDSGKGKSTLASSFHHNGARLITDDCLLLEIIDGQVVAIPNYYGLRLFNDSATAIFGEQPDSSPVAHYTQKRRLQLPSSITHEPETSFRLTSIFLFTDTDTDTDIEHDPVQINPIKGAEKIMAMIKQAFLLDITDMSLISRQFKDIGRLMSSDIKIYQLGYPRQHSMLPHVRSRIEDIL